MSILAQIKNIKGKVKFLLETHPHLRDNDYKLIANIWYNELQDKTITVKQFLENFAGGKFTHTESIRRVRQKLQQTNPSLRGLKYNQRIDDSIEMTQQIQNT